ncbi:MAG: D-alanine--D-alanine ligase [Candidatus Marinimicrobia bacterium]|nr:D-alanine--D-alanine ligase [Candidatus Neomarinimicrobiota bacterium]MBT3691587.1 D-alanine--D-alanine ligase [Candidatus Neomarinimicrobiota bacterium]MBT3731458.1 D-alanine--D-alanine ligase [Candidatus Neomarinimicrobiota bacterium]MBT4144160.1 D-alanine--D-alanine ligase [Candidatus Neomarinimicrobiota bacterium]MBT4178525.1 D-alanine--D-alanine ligase [Candidatus Neomarinimicrobiota bacterium]
MKSNSPLKVGVLYGGNSEERDVSMQTGKAVMKACQSLGYKAIELELQVSLSPLIEAIKKMDVIFIALHGGSGENGQIQSELKKIDAIYTGSGPESSALCMDKSASKNIAKSNSINTADWETITENDLALIKIQCPFVVKPNDQGSTVGLSIVHKESELQAALDIAFKFGDEIMVESYIDGRELTVAIIDGKAMPIVEIIPSHELYDYECKYTAGMSEYECPANLSQNLSLQIQKDAVRLFEALGCEGYGRIDFLLDQNEKYYFLEMNTLPGMTSTSLVPKAVAARGDSFLDLVRQIIETAMK